MPPPKFIFVRHGEAEHNVAAHGPEGDAAYTNPKYKDAPLTPTGIEQARATARALMEYSIIDIWTSPLTRTIQTAEEIYEETSGGEVYLHDSLLEVLGGGHVCNDRKPKRELEEEYPSHKNWFLPELPPWWAERENHTSVHRRMLSLVLLLAHMYKDVPENTYICLVSHWGAIHALTGKALKNAEYVIVSLEDLLK